MESHDAVVNLTTRGLCSLTNELMQTGTHQTLPCLRHTDLPFAGSGPSSRTDAVAKTYDTEIDGGTNSFIESVQKSQSQTTFIESNLHALQLHRGEDTH